MSYPCSAYLFSPAKICWRIRSFTMPYISLIVQSRNDKLHADFLCKNRYILLTLCNLLFSVKKKYEQTVASKSESVVSSMDRAIAKRCEEMLKSESLLEDYAGSTGKFCSFVIRMKYLVYNYIVMLDALYLSSCVCVTYKTADFT